MANTDADALREALWICVEHNALHFGETHNTVVQGRAALASAAHASAPKAAPAAVAEPVKLAPYEPTSGMISEARRIDPALPVETIRALWWAMWRTAPTTQAAPQPVVQQGEPLAWMDDGTLRAGSEATAYRVVTDATKRGMTASLAASFITPLYARPAAPAAQGNALDQGVREELSIGKAINRAARDLPEGWEIRIDLEQHAGVVFLIDPNGNETMSESGELFSDQINAAIDAARGAQGESNG